MRGRNDPLNLKYIDSSLNMLAVTLIFQFKSKKYVPGIYWLAVVLISIVGTLITDNITDKLGLPLSITTIIFAVSLSIVFAVWYKKEKTLSIHTIITARREAFYWQSKLSQWPN